MTSYLSCNVTRGQLSGEWAVRGTGYAGVEFSLFAPQDCVKPVGDASADAGAEQAGLLRVEILKADDRRALVQLPAQTFENGQTVTVARNQIYAV
jgi:hypothetical protein